MKARDFTDLRVVAILGNDSQHRNTLATLIKSGINVVGVCIADNKINGLPLSYIFKSLKKRGILITVSRIIGRIVYLLKNKKLDYKLKNEIFNDKDNRQTIAEANLDLSIAKDHTSQVDFITELKPEILIVHTGGWVGKKVREIENVKYVIGGHPGITPFYRGSHSPFWAIYKNDYKNIGWTCFLLDKGVDTGSVLEQGFLKPNKVETYMSLSWRGMVQIALSQVKAIRMYAANGSLVATEHNSIPDNSEYFAPTLRQHIDYWRKQKLVR